MKKILTSALLALFAITAHAQNLNSGNSLFDVARLEKELPDTIAMNSLWYWISRCDVTYPMFSNEMVVSATALDNSHSYFYRKEKKNFIKIDLGIPERFLVMETAVVNQPNEKVEKFVIQCKATDSPNTYYVEYDFASHQITKFDKK